MNEMLGGIPYAVVWQVLHIVKTAAQARTCRTYLIFCAQKQLAPQGTCSSLAPLIENLSKRHATVPTCSECSPTRHPENVPCLNEGGGKTQEQRSVLFVHLRSVRC